MTPSPMQTLIRVSLIGLFAVWLSGCSHLLPQPDIDQPLQPSVNLSQVPFFPQEPYYCGPSAMATVANYYVRNTTPEGLGPHLWTPSVKGTFALDMIATSRRLKLVPYPAPEEFDELLKVTESGYPSLHLLNLGLNWLPRWHYAVLVGYDLEREEVLMRSGTVKERWMSFKHFEAARRKAGYWGIIPVPSHHEPPLNNATDVYKTLADYGQIQPEDAIAGWESGVKQFRDDWRYYFGLANQLYSTNASRASEAYINAIKLEPGESSIWNNLAYSLTKQQCPVSSQQALSCARAITPESPEIADSWHELSPGFAGATSEANSCPALPACPVESD